MKKPISFALIIFASLTLQSNYLGADEAALPVEPEIVIRHENQKTFYEYRVNGVLKEIKVVPKVGPAYYLVPQDGNAWIREEESQVLVPKWVLFKW